MKIMKSHGSNHVECTVHRVTLVVNVVACICNKTNVLGTRGAHATLFTLWLLYSILKCGCIEALARMNTIV